MKTLALTFLSLIFLFQSLGPTMDWCCNLPKIPNLVEHYKEQAEDTGISFLKFINDHYGDQETSQSHEKDGHDEELPFQGSHSCCNVLVYIDTLEFKSFSLEFPQPQTTTTFYQRSFSSASLGSLFQPPKA
ncbi:hypothetical protein LB467_15505 [Salegentibacter sp. JZCK2]|uniref:hypothetical protein n=1 Tax=Salegentibacter tibetensis TaxID=2873600 RepID=UPI001CCDEB97|nr:hypothetical protein [Salegentibacter tibetensis]MBZ9731101.1 hypothetical protein [Salegentibacter tibetensis]